VQECPASFLPGWSQRLVKNVAAGFSLRRHRLESLCYQISPLPSEGCLEALPRGNSRPRKVMAPFMSTLRTWSVGPHSHWGRRSGKLRGFPGRLAGGARPRASWGRSRTPVTYVPGLYRGERARARGETFGHHFPLSLTLSPIGGGGKSVKIMVAGEYLFFKKPLFAWDSCITLPDTIGARGFGLSPYESR